MTKKRRSPAIYFLAIVGVLAVLAGIGRVWLDSNEGKVLTWLYLPTTPIINEEPAPAPDYTGDAAWAVRPGLSSTADLLPAGVEGAAQPPAVDVFYIHPTTYLNKARWNAPLDDAEADAFLDAVMLKGQASAFTGAGRVFAPRYRQASFGAFLDKSGQGFQAILRAYADVLAAFDHYMATENQGRPLILAGHSQGALHAAFLLRDRIVQTKLRDQLVAAYVIGWPIGAPDWPMLPGLDVCQGAEQVGCLISWQTFGAGADGRAFRAAVASLPGLSGQAWGGLPFTCVNPLTWRADDQQAAPAALHLGAVATTPGDTPPAAPITGLSGARCGDDGLLYLTSALDDDWGRYALSGENMHVYDIHLFYMNVRENAAVRAKQFLRDSR